jgi:hypothetical protein
MLALFKMVILGSVETTYADTIQYSFTTINLLGRPAAINNLDQIVGRTDVLV